MFVLERFRCLLAVPLVSPEQLIQHYRRLCLEQRLKQAVTLPRINLVLLNCRPQIAPNLLCEGTTFRPSQAISGDNTQRVVFAICLLGISLELMPFKKYATSLNSFRLWCCFIATICVTPHHKNIQGNRISTGFGANCQEQVTKCRPPYGIAYLPANQCEEIVGRNLAEFQCTMKPFDASFVYRDSLEDRPPICSKLYPPQPHQEGPAPLQDPSFEIPRVPGSFSNFLSCGSRRDARALKEVGVSGSAVVQP